MHYLILVLATTAFADAQESNVDAILDAIFPSEPKATTTAVTQEMPIGEQIIPTPTPVVSIPYKTSTQKPIVSTPATVTIRNPPNSGPIVDLQQEGGVLNVINSLLQRLQGVPSGNCFFCHIVVQPEIKLTISDKDLNQLTPTIVDNHVPIGSSVITTNANVDTTSVKIPTDGYPGLETPTVSPPAVDTSMNGNSKNSVDTSMIVDEDVVKSVDDTSATGNRISKEPVAVTPTLTNENGEPCQCVPYYLCKMPIADNNKGIGLIDIRFGEDSSPTCQDSLEVCCTQVISLNDTQTTTEPAKPQGCGYRNPLGDLISLDTEDTVAKFGEFPWVVAIMNSTNLYQGVGALIHPQVVITGAHIATKYYTGAMKIRAGEWDVASSREIYEHQERDVTEVYIHEAYQPRNLLINCVALLRLSEAVNLVGYPNINVICLPEQDERFGNHKKCVANGWGKTEYGRQGIYSVIMKKVEMDMVEHSRCNSLLRKTRLGGLFNLHSSFVCAGGEEGKDTCQGDGGAPLACPMGNNQYKLTGMVIWSIGCGRKQMPAVYTNVAAFRSWIDNKLAEWNYL